MTQKDKELLLKDLCARLPYGVIVEFKSREKRGDIKITCGNIGYVAELGNGWWKECKPYLRPMSSMTEKEKEELVKEFWGSHTIKDRFEEICWYLSKHFDINGLIEKGLAIEVTEDNNPYKE